MRRYELKRNTPLKPGTKRMKQGRSTDTPTAEESAWIVAVKSYGCICCRLNPLLGLKVASGGACQAHHLLSGGIRRGHLFTLGLCPWHHQGEPPVEGMGEADAINTYGPTVATGSKPFHEKYGTDDELLEFQVALLAQIPTTTGAAA